jgi:hypothetical protein
MMGILSRFISFATCLSAPTGGLPSILAAFVFMGVFCAEASAFVLQKTGGNKYEYWIQGDMPIAYKVCRGTGDALPLEWIPAITSGFDTWEAVSTAAVSFSYTGTSSTNTKGNDGQNVVIWVTEDGNWSYGSNVSAYTTVWINSSTGRILGFDMEINATPTRIATHPWSASGEAGKMDLQNAVTHEVGHVLGLGHVDNPDATMYPYLDLGETKKRDLDADDVNGVSFVYPTEVVVFEMVSGNDQTGTSGLEPLRVKVSDGGGAPLEGELVIFDLISGSGTLVPTDPAVTDAGGVADATFNPAGGDKAVVRAVAPGLVKQVFWVNNHAPVLSWTGEAGYVSDGVDPETGYGDTYFIFEITYTDADNDAPEVSVVWIDMDGDNFFEADEQFMMFLMAGSFSSGAIHFTPMNIPFSSGSSNVKYYFEFRDRADLPPAGGISSAISPETAINAPDVLQTPGNSPPWFAESDPQTVIMDEDGDPTAFSLTLNASDDEGNTIYWSISDPASHGVATASFTGTQKAITYTPDPDYNGTDAFTVRIYDYLGGTDTLTVNVSINAVLNLADAIISLQLVSGVQPGDPVYRTADVNGDGKIGLEETIYSLQKVSGLRP